MNHYDKQAKEMLRSAKGREALERLLGVEIKNKPEEAAEDLPIVACLVPCYHHPDPRMQDAFIKMQRASAGHCHMFPGPPVSMSVIHWSRNLLIAELLKTQRPWTHVLMIDDDIVPKEDSLIKLLSHKKDIVVGLCTRRTDPPIPNIREFDEKTGIFREVWAWPSGQLIGDDKPLAGGTGMALFSRHALEQVAEAYFRCLYEREFYGMPEEKALELQQKRLAFFDETANAHWFRFLPCMDGTYEMGEDIGFGFMAYRYGGVRTYCDTSVQPGHVGQYVYSISDFLAHQRMAIARVTAQGKIPKIVESGEKISILCPTRNRPDNVKRLVSSLRETADVMPEVILYVDEDDNESRILGFDQELKFQVGPRITLSDMWNELAKIASGDILMFAADDLVFKTKGWDAQVKSAFAQFEDKILFVHGDDGHWGAEFGTHGFMHRKWVDTLGYLLPPYFSADYGDTWVNEVAERVGRRLFLPFVTEHMHPLWKKAEWDNTHKERLKRMKDDRVEELYRNLAPERIKDAEKLRAVMAKEEVPVG